MIFNHLYPAMDNTLQGNQTIGDEKKPTTAAGLVKLRIQKLKTVLLVNPYRMHRCPTLTCKLITIWIVTRRMKNGNANTPIRINFK